MEPETFREMHEALTHYGYARADQTMDKSESDGADYWRRSEADRADRHTLQRIYIQEDGFWEHRFLSLDEDRGWLHGGSGTGVGSLKAYLQQQDEGSLKDVSYSDTLLRDFARGTPLVKTIDAFASLLEARGLVQWGHSANVSRLASKTAQQVGLSEAEVEEIRLAGLVHDIGKLAIPSEVLTKTAPLTPAELTLIRGHAVSGAQILEPLKLEGIQRIVHHHHERYDGAGYPDQLKGDDIPLGARIVAVAEAFDVMVRDQRYKRACSFEVAVAELRSCSGTQFDPKVVTAFLDSREIHGNTSKQG
jgi:putative nucleotidyltransferase with HDIG domain